MDIEILTTLSSLGIGAIFGIVVFLIYRQEKKATEDRLGKLLEKEQETRERHTAVLTELVTLLKKINGHGS